MTLYVCRRCWHVQRGPARPCEKCGCKSLKAKEKGN